MAVTKDPKSKTESTVPKDLGKDAADAAIKRIDNAAAKAAETIAKTADDASKKMMAFMTDLFKKKTNTEEIKQDDNLTLSEIGKGNGIEVTSEKDMLKKMEIEAFMAEKVMICVHEATEESALEIIVVTVNGKNQAIIRGRDQLVKRKYVEALANSRITTYRQVTPDASKPDAIQMVPKTALTYPFAVIEDKHKYGRAWLQALLNQK